MQINIPLIFLLIVLIIVTIALYIFFKINKTIILKCWIQSGLIAILITTINILVNAFFNPGFLLTIILYGSFLLVALPVFEYLQKKDFLFLLQKILFVSIFIVALIEIQFKFQHEIIDVILGFIIVALIFVSVLTIKENIISIKERFKNPPWKRP